MTLLKMIFSKSLNIFKDVKNKKRPVHKYKYIHPRHKISDILILDLVAELPAFLAELQYRGHR